MLDSRDVRRAGFLEIDDPNRGDNSQQYILSKERSDTSSFNQPSRGVDTIASFSTPSPVQLATYPPPISRPTTSLDTSHPTISYDIEQHALVYKPVARKVRTVPEAISEEFHITRRLPDFPLAGLPDLPVHPPIFVPGTRFTLERSIALDLDPAKWLWPDELNLVRWLVLAHETTFVWDPGERGRFKEEYFPPVRIATVPHTPWVQRNIPIPPAIYPQVIEIIKGKIEGGVYEPSNAAYRSRFFTVEKKGGKLRLVHDLQPLNAVTIRDSAMPPFTDHLTEALAGYAIYGMMDLYGGHFSHPQKGTS